jgi:hypothetical protein
MIVIIIGLPCSGKTTLSDKYLNNGYKIFDDFLDNYFDNTLLNCVKNKKNLCINDPRLCIFSVFEDLINDLLFLINENEINIIIYHNQPNKCIDNLNLREINLNKKNKIYNSILSLTKNYDINKYLNYKYLLKENINLIDVFNV